MKTFKLEPVNQKSFYSKAIVTVDNDISTLKSYSTNVATYNHITNVISIKGYYSQTTAKHINAFLNYYGFDSLSKKEIQNFVNK